MLLLNMEVHRVSYCGDNMIQLTDHLHFIASFKRQKLDFYSECVTKLQHLYSLVKYTM